VDYLPHLGLENPPEALESITQYVPLWIWSVLWIVAGLYGIIVAITQFRHPEGARAAGFTLCALGLIWGTTYIYDWLDGLSGDHNSNIWPGIIQTCTGIGTAMASAVCVRLTYAYQEIAALQAERSVITAERNQARAALSRAQLR